MLGLRAGLEEAEEEVGVQDGRLRTCDHVGFKWPKDLGLALGLGPEGLGLEGLGSGLGLWLEVAEEEVGVQDGRGPSEVVKLDCQA